MDYQRIYQNVYNLGYGVSLPNPSRNYALFDEKRTRELVEAREAALPYIDSFLKTADTEEKVVDGLQVLDKMLDNNVQGIDKMYPTLSRFNNAASPNIQVMLSGIYRKTLIPDAFGPLNKMLVRQTLMPNSPYFDPTEETGGAILEYLRNAALINAAAVKKQPLTAGQGSPIIKEK